MSEMYVNKKCGICGSKLKRIEITDEENSTKENWVTKMSVPLCRNHNPYIGWNLEKFDEQIPKIVEKINNKEMTVKRKSKFFLENKEELGITRY